MLDIFSATILGVVQGLTEFLPISSSGHLILVRDFFGLATDYGLSVDAVLHFATALAILVYFRRDLLRLFYPFLLLMRGKRMVGEDVEGKKDRVLLLALVFGTVPAVILGLLLEEMMETIFRNAELVAYALLAGSLILWLAEKYASQNSGLTAKNGLIIGFFQSLALIPGMSRAGMAISGGLFLGLSREQATRFSFLLGFPLFLGSGLKKMFELNASGAFIDIGLLLLAGAAVAFVVGILSIHYLLMYLKSHTIHIFIWYRVALAVIILSSTYLF